MAGRRPQKPKATVFVQMPKASDPKTQRALDPAYQAILDLQARLSGEGTQGEQGDPGPAGTSGSPGANGADGSDGADGADGTFTPVTEHISEDGIDGPFALANVDVSFVENTSITDVLIVTLPDGLLGGQIHWIVQEVAEPPYQIQVIPDSTCPGDFASYITTGSNDVIGFVWDATHSWWKLLLTPYGFGFEAGDIDTASNVGGEKEVFKIKSGMDLVFRTLKAGANIALTQNTDDITIAASGVGEVNTASNVGSEKEVFKAKTGVDLAFRTLKAGSNVTLTQNANDITIASTDTGEVNTASNVGGEKEVFKAKTSADLAFRTLKAGTNVTLTQNTNDIEIASESLSDTSVNLGLFGSGEGGDLVFDGTSTINVALYTGAGTFPAYAPVSTLNRPVNAAAQPTYTLVADLYADDLTINSGVAVLTGGFRVFVKGTFTLNGTIGYWGADGGHAQTGVLENGGGAGASARSANTVGGGSAGGAGGATGANGVNGGALSNGWWGQTQGANTAAAAIGQGGGGGNRDDLGLNPGDGGAVTGMGASAGSNNIQGTIGGISGRSATGVIVNGGAGGGGGTGGGPPASQGGGGGGGGGAGVCVVVARTITGSGTINCAGGYGGDAKPTDADGAEAGGGGGGAGGIILLVQGYGTFPTCTVAGGTGGGKGANNTATNGVGHNGGGGAIYQTRVIDD